MQGSVCIPRKTLYPVAAAVVPLPVNQFLVYGRSLLASLFIILPVLETMQEQSPYYF